MPVTIESVARQLIASVDSDAGYLFGAQWIIKRYEQLAIKAKLRHLRQVGQVSTPSVHHRRFHHDHPRQQSRYPRRHRASPPGPPHLSAGTSADALPGTKSSPTTSRRVPHPPQRFRGKRACRRGATPSSNAGSPRSRRRLFRRHLHQPSPSNAAQSRRLWRT